jgi:S1-C subfamily serine protease
VNGSAAEAGIKKGDVIRKVGDIEVNNFTGLQEQIGNYRPGDNVAITVQREKEVITIPVKLKNKDGSTTLFKRNDELLNMMGANFEEFTNTYGNIQGLKVTKITSGKFKSVGIKEGFLLLKVNGKPVKTKDDLVSNLSESDNSVYIEGVYPSGEKAYYAFGL